EGDDGDGERREQQGGCGVAQCRDGEGDGRGVLEDADDGADLAARAVVDGEAEPGLGSVCGEGGEAGEGGGGHADFRWYVAQCGEGEEGGRGRTDEGVDRIPEGVDVADLVRDELDEVEGVGGRDDEGVGEPHDLRRHAMDPAEAERQPEYCDGCVEVETGREGDTQELADEEDRAAHGVRVTAIPEDAGGTSAATAGSMRDEGSDGADPGASSAGCERARSCGPGSLRGE